MRALPVAVAIAMAAAVMHGCSKETKRYVPNAGEDAPTMTTINVSTLISDSGYTRYHLEAPVWYIYDESDEPFWLFPQGLHVEQYDMAMNPAANVEADSAIYFSRKRLWRLDGNVVMVNTQADSFLTQQIFWDQASKELYTDSFIHIVRTDQVLEGYGFRSNEQMTDFIVTRPTAILPSEMLPGGKKAAGTGAVDPANDEYFEHPPEPVEQPTISPAEESRRKQAKLRKNRVRILSDSLLQPAQK